MTYRRPGGVGGIPRDELRDWARYYAGRVLQGVGILLVTAAMALFFGTSEMRPMLAVTGGGSAVYVLGWLIARKKPKGAR